MSRQILLACIPGGGLDVWFLAAMDEWRPVGIFDILGQFNRVKTLFFRISAFVPFLIKANPSKTYPSILDWTRRVKGELPTGAKLGAAGFSWSGWMTTTLCTETATLDGSETLLDAQITAHPISIKDPATIVDAVKIHNVLYSLAVGEHDHHMNGTQMDGAEAALAKFKEEGQALHFELIVCKGMLHGFSVRGDSEDKNILDAMKGAKNQAIDWFNRWL